MPALRIIWDTEDDCLSEEDVEDMNRFVELFMFHRNHEAPLDFCEIRMNEFDWEGPLPHIDLWIQQALLSQVRNLSVEVDSFNTGLCLSDTPLISKHLTRLKLVFVRLENKFLNFSSCPTLKSLWLTGCEIATKKISSQSLQHLTIIESIFTRDTRTCISAPSLVWLQLTDNTTIPILENMPSLEEYGGSCSKDSCDNCDDKNDKIQGCLLLKGMSQAESLELVAQPGSFIFKRDLMWCPTFSKLKTLLLNEWCVAINFDPLLCFLEHAPVLEKLTLQLRQMPDNWVEPRGFYFYVPSDEPFASKNLKVIEIKCQQFDERVHQISKILSTYNIYLEQINIQWSSKCSE
ncbi:hypothetical protein EJB05_28849, partial [Eragrostis curvula]